MTIEVMNIQWWEEAAQSVGMRFGFRLPLHYRILSDGKRSLTPYAHILRDAQDVLISTYESDLEGVYEAEIELSYSASYKIMFEAALTSMWELYAQEYESYEKIITEVLALIATKQADYGPLNTLICWLPIIGG